MNHSNYHTELITGEKGRTGEICYLATARICIRGDKKDNENNKKDNEN